MMFSRKNSISTSSNILFALLICLLPLLSLPVYASMGTETNELGPGWYNQTNLSVYAIDDFIQEAQSNDNMSANSTEPPAEVAAEFVTLAASLRNDPVRIYNYVHNRIDYVPYFGHLKGASRTLLDMAGNDADQADLLIQLLRAAGYSAEFVTGEMYIPYSSDDDLDLNSWLQAAWYNAYRTLVQGGIPLGNYSGNNLDVFRVWARVLDGGTWYELDPAFKRYDSNSSIDLSQLSGYSRAELFTAAGGSSSGDYALSLSLSGVADYLTTLTTNLSQNLQNQYRNSSIEEIAGGSYIIQEEISAMSNQVHFTTSGKTYYTELPDETYGHPFSLDYDNIQYSGYLHKVACDGLTLCFADSVNPDNGVNIIESVPETVYITESVEEPVTSIVSNVDSGNLVSNQTYDATNSYDIGIVYEDAPDIVLDLYNRPEGVSNEAVTLENNTSSAYSDVSDTEKIKVKFSPTGQSSGTKTVKVVYSFTYQGGSYSWIYNLSATVRERPSISDGSFAWYSPVKYIAQTNSGIVRLKNTGTKNLSITSVTLTGTDADKFQLISDYGAGTISPNSYRDITVSYKADTAGLHTNAYVHFDFTYDTESYSWDFLPLQGETINNLYAQLLRGDELLSQNLAPLISTNMILTISHPYTDDIPQTVSYSIKSGGMYAIITGFGSSENGNLPIRQRKKIKELQNDGTGNQSPEIMTASLHLIGQTWLQETTLYRKILDNIMEVRQRVLLPFRGGDVLDYNLVIGL